MTQTRSPMDPRFLLVTAALFWSSGGVLIKSVEAGPLAVAGLRSIVAGLCFIIGFRPKLWPLTKIQIAGAIAYAATVLCFVTATKWTSSANAILLQSTAPIHVALLGSLYLKEKINRMDWITIAFVFVGMLCFFQGQMSLDGMRGNVLGLVSGLAFAIFILITRKHHNQSSITMIALGNILAAVLTLPFALQQQIPSVADFKILFFLGVFQLALPYALYSKAIQKVRAIDAVLIVLIEPILNPIWVFIVLGERPTLWGFIGGLIVLGSVTARSLLSIKTK